MTAAIEVNKLRKVYEGGLEALKGIDLAIPEGSFYGLLGPNGAGKTTTIGIITGLVHLTSGTASIMGYDTILEYRKSRRLIGLSPQELNFDVFFSIGELLTLQAGYYGLPHAKAKERTTLMLQQFGLTEKRKSRSRELSGGMKRRVQIAKALVHDPPIIILDEPTKGIDVGSKSAVHEFMGELVNEGMSIIMISAELPEIMGMCDRVAVVYKGLIRKILNVSETSSEEILSYASGE